MWRWLLRLLASIAAFSTPVRGRGKPITATSLYDAKDPITQLTAKDFDGTVYGRRKAFFVEFYSSWCGGCIAYAPKWKAIARSFAPWAAVLEVAAVNCADDANTDLCQAHSIDRFPTLKYFKFKSSSASDGISYEEERQNVEKVAGNVATLVYHDWRRQEPPNWPPFLLAADTQRVKEILGLHSAWEYLAMVVEAAGEGDSKLVPPFTASLTLEWSSVDGVGVVGARPSHPSIGGQIAEADTPSLLVFKRGDPDPIFVARKKISTRAEINARIAEATNLIQPPNARSLASSDSGVRNSASSSAHSVSTSTPHATTALDLSKVNRWQANMGDLKTGLRYMLHKEIGLKKELSGEKLSALDAFLKLAAQHFPGLPPLRRLLFRLSGRVSSLAASKASLLAQEWTTLLEKEEEDLGRPLPEDSSWAACQGSEARFRGYPCSLWTMFHSLTVAVYKAEGKDPNFDPRRALEAIRGYVLNFFGCQDCVEHFEEHASRIEKAVREPEEVVLWLWEVHNNANQRTKGSASEDPAFPKLQFPTNELCPACHRSDGSWDRSRVLEFLLKFYGENIQLDNHSSPYKVVGFDGKGKKTVESKALDLNPKFKGRGERVAGLEKREMMLRKERERMEGGWRSRGRGAAAAISTTTIDLSFCFSVWVACMALLTLIYVYLRFRRVRHRYFKNSEHRV